MPGEAAHPAVPLQGNSGEANLFDRGALVTPYFKHGKTLIT